MYAMRIHQDRAEIEFLPPSDSDRKLLMMPGYFNKSVIPGGEPILVYLTSSLVGLLP